MQKTKRLLFTERENIIIKECVRVFGEDWDAISLRLPGRTPKQIHDRYINYLRNGLKRDPWTKQEDEILIKMYKAIGPKWTKMMVHLPGRSGNDIKNRWHKHLFKKTIKTKNEKQESNNDFVFDDNNISISDKSNSNLMNNNDSSSYINDNLAQKSSTQSPQIFNKMNDQYKNEIDQNKMSSNQHYHAKLQKDDFEKKNINILSQNEFSNSHNQKNLENQAQMSIKIINKVEIKQENKVLNGKNSQNNVQDIISAIFKPESEIQEIFEDLNSHNLDFSWI